MFFTNFPSIINDFFTCIYCLILQTGSGKTYTILGDEGHPGIAPRTFSEIFSLAQDMSQTYETLVSFYVLELYNDKLIDLLNPPSHLNPTDSPDTNKLEIRRDRRGTVWVSGNTNSYNALFQATYSIYYFLCLSVYLLFVVLHIIE